MKIKIFQINPERGDGVYLLSRCYDSVRKDYGGVPAEAYDCVFEEEFIPGAWTSAQHFLEELYNKYKSKDSPLAKAARPICVSDVVRFIDPAEDGFVYYYCDTIGFTKIEFDESKVEGANTPGKYKSKVESLVSRGWIEGLVRVVGDGDSSIGGIACKIGTCAFWFDPEEGEYETLEAYFQSHSIEDMIGKIVETIISFSEDETNAEEAEYYIDFLEENLFRGSAVERIHLDINYLRKRYGVSDETARVIDAGMRWAYTEMSYSVTRSKLIRALLAGYPLSEIELYALTV